MCPASRDPSDDASTSRDPALRDAYLREALAGIPRLLGAVDRNPYRPTYGCLDRQYWHYRTADFPSEMYQEGVLPLAWVHAIELPGNAWHGDRRVRELAVAGMRFAARSSHRDGSCDDYYPFERALGAAVFSLRAAAAAYQLLRLDDPPLRQWLIRRADWIVAHDESGHLANHHALAAVGLLRVGQITGDSRYTRAAEEKIDTVLRWQSDEGWFEEYGGADPGYQTVTIECLAQYARLGDTRRLDAPLRRAVALARMFLHPDGSFAGEYGSRGTYHFHPHGMELLAADNADAADLADGFLQGLWGGRQAHFADDRMFAHRLAGLIEAYVDWAPTRPPRCDPAHCDPPDSLRYLPGAQMLVHRAGARQTIVSAARGGVFKHFSEENPAVTDAGLILETTSGRVAVSQQHERTRQVRYDPAETDSLVVSGSLHWARSELVGPLKQALLHLGTWAVSRWCRTLVRRLLQRRLITGRVKCPVHLTRSFDFSAGRLRVTDTIRLQDARLQVRRMHFGTDHQTAYVAACGVYQQSVLHPWTDLEPYLQRLNAKREVTIQREFD